MDAENTRMIFERSASRYDTADRIREASIIVKAICGRLRETEGKTLLEYGCGTGLVGLGLAKNFGKVTLVDNSQNMIDETQKKIDAMNLHHVSTSCADFALQAPDDTRFDYIVLSLVLLHVANVVDLLKVLSGLLNDGGHLIIVDFDKNEHIVSDLVHNGFDQIELLELVRHAGFTSVETATFYHGKKMFMGKDASLFLLDAVKGQQV